MLTDIILYVIQKTCATSARPNQKSIEMARLIFILYLIDWHSAIKNDRTMTDIQWRLKPNWMSDSGEIEKATNDPIVFKITYDPVICLSNKARLLLLTDKKPREFELWQMEVLNRVLAVANQRSLVDLLTFTFSTYPLLTADSNLHFDMLVKARIYKSYREQQKK